MLSQQQSIKVVDDHWRMPTLVDDLAQASLSVIEQNIKGIFHICGKEMLSVYEFALQVANFYHLDSSLIHRISAKEIGQENNRPQKTGFHLDKVKSLLNYRPKSIIEGLQAMGNF